MAYSNFAELERVLILLKDNPKMTAKQLASTLGLSGRQIERTIATLKAAGRNVLVQIEMEVGGACERFEAEIEK